MLDKTGQYCTKKTIDFLEFYIYKAEVKKKSGLRFKKKKLTMYNKV